MMKVYSKFVLMEKDYSDKNQNEIYESNINYENDLNEKQNYNLFKEKKKRKIL